MSGKNLDKINVFEKKKQNKADPLDSKDTTLTTLLKRCRQKSKKQIRSMSESVSEKFFFPEKVVSKCSNGYLKCFLGKLAEKKFFVKCPKWMKEKLFSQKKHSFPQNVPPDTYI